jgi:hypothetical protein
MILLSRSVNGSFHLFAGLFIILMVACSPSVSDSSAQQSTQLEAIEAVATIAAGEDTLQNIQPFNTPAPEEIVTATKTRPESEQHSVVTLTPALVPGQIGPNNIPENVNPLTGEAVDDPAILDRRPIAVKISNISSVRPQAGLNSADLIFEHLSEAGITRFTAIFYSQDASRVGSIRSGRLIDLEIPLMYDAAFAYSGSSSQIRQMIRDSNFFDRVISPDFAHSGFERILDAQNPSEKYVDSMFTDTNYLRWVLERRGIERRPELLAGMVFHPEPPPGGTLAEQIEIDYIATNILWSFNPGTGRYQRWNDGQSHLDANTGEIVSFTNIIVLGAEHFNTEIIEDSAGHPSIQIQIWKSGPATIFRDGQRYEGRWRRDEPEHMLSFYDLDGNVLPLAPGNTFFEVVPLDLSAMEVKP